MANLIPLGSTRFDARGELHLAERLKDCLEDNPWVWHNIPVGPFGRHPDFVALHPQQGIVVLDMRQELLARSLEPVSAGFVPRVDVGRGWMQGAACRRWSFHRQGLQRRRRRTQRQPGGPLACGRIAALRPAGGE